MAESFLIISASMGAGHDGAARELARRLESEGHVTEVVDFLACLPGIGGSVKRVYQFQLEMAPWSYEALYRVFFKVRWLYRPLTWLVTALSSRRVRRHISRTSATAVVTTYPLASLVLGNDRRRGKILVPVATFVTDFAVHPLWVHPGVDANVCVHPDAALSASISTGRPSSAPGPLVPTCFTADLPERTSSRAALGIPDDAVAVLVVAGSWGVGDLESTFDDLIASGRYFPVVACGSNETLRASLAARAPGNSLVLGWTDAMPQLMAACDVLLQNAGGLTCMEAFAAGLPVLTYRPIPGHGVENAVAMDRAGVAPFVRDPEDLLPSLERATTLAGLASSRRGRALFTGDAADEVVSLALSSRTRTPTRRARALSAGRRLGRSAAAAAVVYAGFTFGADAAVAHGFGVAHPRAGAPVVYVGVRIGATALSDSTLAGDLARSGVTAIVGGTLARGDSPGVATLAVSGTNVANGGWGTSDDALDLIVPEVNVARAARAISADTGFAPVDFVPPSGVNAFDFSAARLEHERIVRPNLRIPAGSRPGSVARGEIVVIDATASTADQVRVSLAGLRHAAGGAGLRVEPLSSLH